MDGRTREGLAARAERKARACELRRRGFRIATIAERLEADPATVSMWCSEGGISPHGYVDEFSPLAKSDNELYTWHEADVVLTIMEMVRDGELVAMRRDEDGTMLYGLARPI